MFIAQINAMQVMILQKPMQHIFATKVTKSTISIVKAKILQPPSEFIVRLNNGNAIAVRQIYYADWSIVLNNKEDTVAYTHLFLRE